MIQYLKQARRPLGTRDPETSATVADILESLDPGTSSAADPLAAAESTARQLALRFDEWSGPIVVSPEVIAHAEANLPSDVKADIAAAHARIRRFAVAQRESMTECEVELSPGLTAGHRLVPVTTAGCYVPAGRFAHIASALMSVTTAHAAGVEKIVVTSPAREDREGVHPAIIYAAKLAGATHILGLGGVQGVGALAYGLFSGLEADIIVGPGNAFVAEAKRQLFGRVGIDVVAGPTESMIAADGTADAHMIATDLVGQAEHGPDSPVWFVTTDETLAQQVLDLVPRLAEALPGIGGTSATAAWESYGEVAWASTAEEAAAMCDDYAPEHLQVFAQDLDWWKSRLRNYGSLFLGPETNVTFGDKASGPNHILPTGRAARYSGGLNVGRFIKQLTWQELTPEASVELGHLSARISRLEGMEGHARSADLRVERYGGSGGRS